jgi:putative ABC transport system substrate-binding protein
VRRRKLITVLGSAAAAWPLAAHAQQDVRIRRIGFLRVGPPPASFIDGFRQGLRELGFIEGQHFVIEYALTQSAAEVPAAAAELVRSRVDIIVASGTPSVLPVKDAAAGQIPVVFVATFDPVATGLIASLARPGGSITGATSISGDVIAKRMQMMRELLPKLTRIAILVRESSPTAAQYVLESKTAARNLGIDLQIENERSPDDLDGIFVAVKGSNALVLADDGLWSEFPRPLSAGGEPCVQDPAGRQPCRSSGRATHKIRVRAEHANSEDARAHHSGLAPSPC